MTQAGAESTSLFLMELLRGLSLHLGMLTSEDVCRELPTAILPYRVYMKNEPGRVRQNRENERQRPVSGSLDDARNDVNQRKAENRSPN